MAGNVYKGYQFKEDLSPWLKFNCPGPFKGTRIKFNPVVTFVSILLIWGFAAWCILAPDSVPFDRWQRLIVYRFTWFYIGSQDVWAVFIIYLYFSKYSGIRLGKPGEKPEFNDVSWFMMLFACGIGTGLFFYGVAEPIKHYTARNRYSADETMPDNTLAQWAMTVTLYHWGFHSWVVYSITGLLLALLCHREGLPMTMKSCFYPLIRDRIFGWIGDVVDIVSICSTLFGVCTSLGLGARQLNSGLNVVWPDTFPADNQNVQIVTLWVITAIAAASTASGVGLGIRRFSEFCMVVGLFLMILTFCLTDGFYILNLLTQSIGHYIQYIIQLGFHCDTFENLGQSFGSRDRHRFIPPGEKDADGPKDWMENWTMFYWGWWISWSPFVGTFIAKISRGRTIRDFITGTMTMPVAYSILWLVIFGGVGIKMEREAAEEKLCCPTDVGWFSSPETIMHLVKNRTTLVSQITGKGLLCDVCSDCANRTMSRYKNLTVGQFIDDYKLLGKDFGSVLPSRLKARLSCHPIEQMWFDLMRSVGELGGFLSGFSMIGIVLYFVTSSDSGSLVIDNMSANGAEDLPVVQRVFWSFTEGAAATALLIAGGDESLKALRALGLTSGFPYTFVICLLCTSIWRAVRVAANDEDPFSPTFACGVFDPIFAAPYKHLTWAKDYSLFKLALVNIVKCPVTVAKAAAITFSPDMVVDNFWWKWMKYALLSVPVFLLAIVFMLLEIFWRGCWAVGIFFYFCSAVNMMAVRGALRQQRGIIGNYFEDFISTLFLYPLVAAQLELTTELIWMYKTNQGWSRENGEGSPNLYITSLRDLQREEDKDEEDQEELEMNKETATVMSLDEILESQISTVLSSDLREPPLSN